MVKVGGWGLRPVGGPLKVGGDQNRQCMVLPEISFFRQCILTKHFIGNSLENRVE